jgi:hypothetical protein
LKLAQLHEMQINAFMIVDECFAQRKQKVTLENCTTKSLKRFTSPFKRILNGSNEGENKSLRRVKYETYLQNIQA